MMGDRFGAAKSPTMRRSPNCAINAPTFLQLSSIMVAPMIVLSHERMGQRPGLSGATKGRDV